MEDGKAEVAAAFEAAADRIRSLAKSIDSNYADAAPAIKEMGKIRVEALSSAEREVRLLTPADAVKALIGIVESAKEAATRVLDKDSVAREFRDGGVDRGLAEFARTVKEALGPLWDSSVDGPSAADAIRALRVRAEGRCPECSKRIASHDEVAQELEKHKWGESAPSCWRAAQGACSSPPSGSPVPDDLRAAGWAVAVHNDYRLHGKQHTFWLMTRSGRAVSGEGLTDTDALGQIRARVARTGTPASSIEEAVASDRDAHPRPVDDVVLADAAAYERQCIRESVGGMKFNGRYLLSIIAELQERRRLDGEKK